MKTLILAILFLPILVFATDFNNSRCLDSIKSYFKQDIDQATMDKFLSIQGRLTMNKLARANLIQSKKSNINNIEKNILHLLKAKHDGNPKLKEAIEFFESQPLSQKALSQVIPMYADILKVQQGKDNPFILATSDIKMLEILGENERVYSSGKQDVRQYNGRLSNFSSLINSSYRNVADNKLREKNIELVQSEIVDSQNAMYKLLESIPIPEACNTAIFQNGCSINQTEMNFADLYFNISEIQDVTIEALYSLVNEKDLIRTTGFGKLWPKVVLDADREVLQVKPLKRALELHFNPERIEIKPMPIQKSKPISTFQSSSIDASTELKLKEVKLKVMDIKTQWDFTVTSDERNVSVPGSEAVPDIKNLDSAIGITNEIEDMLDPEKDVNYFKLEDQEDIYVVEVKPDNVNAGAHMFVRITQHEDRTMPDYIEYLSLETSKGEYLAKPYDSLDEKLCDYNKECAKLDEQLIIFGYEYELENYFDQFVVNDFMDTFSDEFNKSEKTKKLKHKLESAFESINNKSLKGKELQEALENAGRNAFGDEYDMNSGDIFDRIKEEIERDNLSGDAEDKRVDELLDRYGAITNFRSRVESLSKYKKKIIETSCSKNRASGDFTNYCKLLDAKKEKIKILRSGLKELDPSKKGFPLDGYSRY